MKLRRLVPTIILPLVLWSCFDSQVAGNSTETENNITARLIRVDSVLPSWNRPSSVPTVATLRLDSSNFDFSRTDSTGRDLAVLGLDSVPIPFQIVFWDRVAARGRLHVRIDTSLLRPGSRFILGWRRPLAIRSDSSSVWSAISDSQNLAINSVLVDDFEGGVLQNILPDSAAWYTGKSDSATLSSFGIATAAGGRTGQVLHLAYKADSTTGQYVLATTALASTPRCFRSLDSIVLWERGGGHVGVAFERIANGVSHKAWKLLNLDTGWQRLRVRPQDLDIATVTSGNVGWQAVRDSVTNLTLFTEGRSDLWVDDIRIYGIGPDDLR
jgi:hypothetical protein